MSVPKTFLAARERIGCLQTVVAPSLSSCLDLQGILTTSILDYCHQSMNEELFANPLFEPQLPHRASEVRRA